MNDSSVIPMGCARVIDTVVVHCSDSHYGNASVIDRWHRKRGWECIGYHFVILNSYPESDSTRLRRPEFWKDGTVETGRPLDHIGAHVRGYNTGSVGICLIGKDSFTQQQFSALTELIDKLRGQFPGINIRGHYELLKPGAALKTCPNIDMDWLRSLLGKK